MTQAITLTATKGGIDRQRSDGSPSRDVLFDFLNGYRNQSLVAVSRPGSRCLNDLPSGQTKGFCMFRGIKYVFSSSPQVVDADVVCEVLVHPEDPTLQLRNIHFASPFLQFLYVVAEFTDESVYHYWLRTADTWAALTTHQLGDLVQPTVPNGYVYQARRLGDPNPLWAANVPRTVGDRIEPTTPDGNYYEAQSTIGTNPRSGTTEPDWNTPEGALTYEDVDITVTPTPPTGPTTPPSTPGTGNRYDNPGGSRPGERSEQ